MKLDYVGIRLVKEKTIDYDVDTQSNCKINDCYTAVELIANEIKDMDREVFITVNLDTKNKIINAHVVGIGGLNMAFVDVKNIIKAALLSNANSIIAFHNHPSGEPTPSSQDKVLTDRIIDACKIMDIEFLDHVILGDDYFYSLRGNKTFSYPTRLLEIDENSELKSYVQEHKAKTL